MREYGITVPVYEESIERPRSASPRRDDSPRHDISQYRNRSPSHNNDHSGHVTRDNRGIIPSGNFLVSGFDSFRGQDETSLEDDIQTMMHIGQESQDQLDHDFNYEVVDPWQTRLAGRRLGTVQETPVPENERVSDTLHLIQTTRNLQSYEQESQPAASHELNAHQSEYHAQQSENFMVDLNSNQSGRQSVIFPDNDTTDRTKREDSPIISILESIETGPRHCGTYNVGAATMTPTDCAEWRQRLEMDQIWWQEIK